MAKCEIGVRLLQVFIYRIPDAQKVTKFFPEISSREKTGRVCDEQAWGTLVDSHRIQSYTYIDAWLRVNAKGS